MKAIANHTVCSTFG